MISKSHFIGEHIAKIDDSYEFIKELGEGSYGKVLRVQSFATGHIYACKKMNKRKIKNKERFKTEIDLLRATDHPNIIKLYDIFEDHIYIYLIMEECTGGEFFYRLQKKAKQKKMYTEKDAANIFRQILEAVNYLHAHGVCHRDLKPENILFTTIDENSSIKLIDFGLSKVFGMDSKEMKGVVGTTFYMAPEVILGKYNEKCDVWSCGVILYIMLCGYPPFYAEEEEDLRQKIISMKYTFEYPSFQKISEDAKDLIKKIFVAAEERPNASDLLKHKWITENAPNATGEGLAIEWSQLENYSKLNLLQKSVINFTAFHLSEDNTRKIIQMFKALDKNSDGVLTMDEIKRGFKDEDFGGKYKTEQIINFFNEMDIDKNGLINYTEFVSALIDYKKYIKKEQILECFKNYDADNSGRISFDEFCDMIKPQNDDETKKLKVLFKKCDKNNDGEIDLDEFIDGFNKDN